MVVEHVRYKKVLNGLIDFFLSVLFVGLACDQAEDEHFFFTICDRLVCGWFRSDNA